MRTKHFKIDRHFVRDKVQDGTMRLLLVSSTKQVEYFFTKPLHLKSFLALSSKLGMADIYQAPACGGLLKLKEEAAVT